MNQFSSIEEPMIFSQKWILFTVMFCSDFQETWANVDLFPCSSFIDHFGNFFPFGCTTDTFKQKKELLLDEVLYLNWRHVGTLEYASFHGNKVLCSQISFPPILNTVKKKIVKNYSLVKFSLKLSFIIQNFALIQPLIELCRRICQQMSFLKVICK